MQLVSGIYKVLYTTNHEALILTRSDRGNSEVHDTLWRENTSKQTPNGTTAGFQHTTSLSNLSRWECFKYSFQITWTGIISPALEESETEIKTISVVLTFDWARGPLHFPKLWRGEKRRSQVSNSRVVKYIKVLQSSKEFIFAILLQRF